MKESLKKDRSNKYVTTFCETMEITQTNDQFAYDEGKKSSFLKHDSELFNDEDYVPGNSIRVKRVSSSTKEDWLILKNDEEYLLIKGTRFSSKERVFLRSADGVLFLINGAKQGWNSVSEFKRQLAGKIV